MSDNEVELSPQKAIPDSVCQQDDNHALILKIYRVPALGYSTIDHQLNQITAGWPDEVAPLVERVLRE